MPKNLSFKQELTACFGQPVAENPTQVMVEAAYRHHGLNWRYLTIEVAPANLADAVRGARAMGFAGFNCTIPHKVSVISHLDRLGESASVMGAVNCVVRRGDQLIGENTDGKGFLMALREVIDPKGAHVAMFGAGGAARAIGVELRRGGRVLTVRARREVILAAGAIASPLLLQRSGVGDPEQLRRVGIEPVHARSGVGANLQDHLELYVQMECTQPITLNGLLNPLSKARVGLQWLLFHSGPGATNHFESCAFIRSRAGIEYPDIQYHFLPGAIRYDGRAAAPGHGFQVHVGPMRSKSRGYVRLRSPHPEEPPEIRFNYMAHPDDWLEFRLCIRLTREIFAQPAFAPFRGREIAPGEHVQSDEAIDDFVREHVESAYHPCGTCRMGDPADPLAVVDPECRVIGLEGLRVADSSIIPRITNGNLNAPSIMIGEKASDHILGRPPLPASNLKPWIHPEWQTRQR
jgi:choline dehydrogenase